MRVLFINMYYYPNMIGGAEYSLKLLAERLVYNGIEVFVYTLDSREDKELIAENMNGVKVIRGYSKAICRRRLENNKHIIDKLINGIHSIINVKANNQIKQIVEKIKPNIVHTNNPISISYWVWKYAHKKDIGVVHTIRDYWLMDPTTNFNDNFGLFIKCFRKYHRSLSNNYVDAVTAPSDYVLNIFKKHGYFRNSILQTIVNSIPIDFCELQNCYLKKLSCESDKIKFMFAGYLSKTKGIDQLLKAFTDADLKNASLFICGKGPLIELVKKYELENNNIIYTGNLSQDKLKKVYKESDVLIVPSVWDEPFGRIVIESAQYCTICIGANRGGIPEIINTLGAGECFEPLNNHDFVALIKKYSNRSLIKEQIRYIPYTIKKYDIELQIKNFISIYKRLG